ncbi:MAG: YceD family protein [Thiohalocapsa sp.]|jgi:uncharacterized protein
MREALPQSIDPRRLAELGRELTGRVPLTRLPRLAQVIVDADKADPDYAAYKLSFRRDSSGRDLVQGEVTATLRLRCERCNGILEIPVDGTFTLAVVHGLDEAAGLPDEYEPLLPDEATVDPATLVEDELLLAVPHVPRHAEGACRALKYTANADQPGAESDADGLSSDEHPFAILESLKRHH